VGLIVGGIKSFEVSVCTDGECWLIRGELDEEIDPLCITENEVLLVWNSYIEEG
jgi:hypothetical protein